ncbi:TPA: hypothetical protein HA278_04170 [Candidatus Woesearchaeota archaeon]|nr:hypothetical protein [Candidatus Woesearchaeota archaeon]|tara:strand:+ start:690 stop:833 length:144 start_codon:yes stop_codon:yes gene_type:complete
MMFARLRNKWKTAAGKLLVIRAGLFIFNVVLVIVGLIYIYVKMKPHF